MVLALWIKPTSKDSPFYIRFYKSTTSLYVGKINNYGHELLSIYYYYDCYLYATDDNGNIDFNKLPDYDLKVKFKMRFQRVKDSIFYKIRSKFDNLKQENEIRRQKKERKKNRFRY